MIGTTLDERYTITARLGAGGMGVVYRARDIRLERDVAVKLMGEHLADSEQSAHRFIREAQLAARLDHDNVGRVHDIGRDSSGRLYIVMPLLEGDPLSDLIGDGKSLRASEALIAMADAAAGLSHAHRAGIVHRDVKPGNLFRSQQGRLSVLDFGLARLTEGSGRPTALVGTWDYMAPEQFDPDTFGPIGPAADVYGLTGVLLHAVTGRPPFPDADSFPQLFAAHTHGPRPVPGDLDPRFAWLDPVVARGMAIDQAARPASAESLVAHAIHSWGRAQLITRSRVSLTRPTRCGR
ncbi:serine/threonine-protein kinase [Tsukamurella pseudospumae]|nr:serine/threonine-protein kinase [Tsukamurella pseudospumae]